MPWCRYLKPYYLVIFVILIINTALYLHPSTELSAVDNTSYAELEVGKEHEAPSCDPAMTVVTVICGKKQRRLRQLAALVRSMLFFTSCPLRLIILTDDVKLITARFGKMASAPLFKKSNAVLEIRMVEYPEYLKEKRTMWHSFGPCLTLRLFFASVLPELDAIIYIDTDVFAVSPIEKFWEIFKSMNGTQFMAVVAEAGGHPDIWPWYGRVSRTPYVGASGLNAGVIPMNLTRMRRFGWEDEVLAAYEKYESDFKLIDQDLVNIVLHDHPEGFMSLPHEWNFRNWLCPHARGSWMKEFLPPNVTAKMLHGDSSNPRDVSKLYYYPFYAAIQKLNIHQGNKDYTKQIVEPVIELMKLPFRAQRHRCAALDENLLRSIEDLDPKTRSQTSSCATRSPGFFGSFVNFLFCSFQFSF
ncbi:hypothetical protein RvY_13345 [Ramazzottius varieornatus]|uniref:UDP-D-xylose:beta-D-glucoside alpha-1,3-D-xylosyltransferase n=1 Tax=Ramazzottius varieornatus TaxID=947166 RepID=A0A1D1VML2_RAMVA|nr:hypothetical protein RvY_13345 [Ramazzottius varieornatus]